MKNFLASIKQLIVLTLSLLGPLFFLAKWASADDVTKFNVGIIIPLSGDLADYGTSIQRGFTLASSVAPERFSNIHFVFDDSRYDAKTAVTALEKMRASDSIDLYYAWGVSPTEAIIPITEGAHLPLLVETTLKESAANKKYVVRAARTGERIAQALASELEKRKISNATFLVAEIPFYTDIVSHLERILATKGIKVARVKRILPSENNLRPYLLDLPKQKDAAIGVFLLPPQIISFYKGAAQFKLAPQMFSADIIGSESIIKDCPENINGTFFTEVGVTSEFRDTFSKKFGIDGHIGHAAQAYDVANIISDLFGHLAHKPSGEDIIKAIENLPPQKGATGEFKYSDSVDGGKELRMPVALKEIRKKQIETISENTGF